jgi:hypothetical protein
VWLSSEATRLDKLVAVKARVISGKIAREALGNVAILVSSQARGCVETQVSNREVNRVSPGIAVPILKLVRFLGDL